MSATGLAIIYVIIWWIIFFAILPIDVNRTKIVKIDGEDPGSPENPKMIKNKENFLLNIRLNFPNLKFENIEQKLNQIFESEIK